MVSYNSVHRKILDRISRRIHDSDILQAAFTHINLAGGLGTYEMQAQYLYSTNKTKVTEEFEFLSALAELRDMKRRVPLISTEISVPLRKFMQAEGNEGKIGQLSIEEYAYQHQLVREELVTMNSLTGGVYKGYNNQGLLYLLADASSSINLPASCEGTAGTAETGGSWAGGQRGTMQCAVDMTLIKKDLALQKFYRRKPEENETIIFMHPIALQIIDDFPVYDGAAYLAKSIREYLLANQLSKILPMEAMDSDYAGAEDGTTQVAACANPKDWFLVGIAQGLTTDGFWDNDGHTEKRARIHEGLSWIPIPLYNGTYYKKAVAQVTITPWNNSA